MEVLYPVCCGLDVHKQMVVACLISPMPDDQRHKEMNLFATTTDGLENLAGWLEAAGCTHVAMESTGVYWVRPLTMGGVALRATPE